MKCWNWIKRSTRQARRYRASMRRRQGRRASLMFQPLESRMLLSTLNTPLNFYADNNTVSSIKLHWDDTSDNETYFKIDAYQYDKNGNSISGDTYWIIPENTEEITISGLDSASTYEFQLYAVNNEGISDIQVIFTATRSMFGDSPAPPILLPYYDSGYTHLWFNWLDMADNESSYIIWKKNINGNFEQLTDLFSGATNYNDGYLEPATSYTYIISAVNSNGSANCGPFTLTTPGAPPNNTPHIDNIYIYPYSVKESGGTIALTANGVVDADLNDSLSVKFYRETNGISGLQVGSGGDSWLGTDSDSNDGWTKVVSTYGYPLGMNAIYAQAFDGIDYSNVVTAYITVVPDNSDLVVQAVNGPAEGIYRPGQTIAASATVKNNLDTATSSTLRLYLGTEDGSNKTQYEIGSGYSIGVLSEGYSLIAGNSAWTIPSAVASGQYRIWAKADADGQVTESNESNNWLSSSSFGIAESIGSVSETQFISDLLSTGQSQYYWIQSEGPLGLHLTADSGAGYQLSVYDADGKTLLEQENTLVLDEARIKLASSDYSSSEYYLKVTKLNSINNSYDLTLSPVVVSRFDGSGVVIDPTKQTWLVIHGRESSSRADNIVALAAALQDALPGAQILMLDWSELSAELELTSFTGEDYIQPVAQYVADLLNDLGFNESVAPDNLNLIGHSWGAVLSGEIASRIPGGVNKLIALDPANNFPGGYDTGSVNFRSRSKHSWAFLSSDFGSTYSSETAEESFLVDLEGANSSVGLHSGVVNWYASILRSYIDGVTVGSVTALFHPDQMGQESPWLSNKYSVLSSLGSAMFSAITYNPTAYEAVIRASKSGFLPVTTGVVTDRYETERIDFRNLSNQPDFITETQYLLTGIDTFDSLDQWQEIVHAETYTEDVYGTSVVRIYKGSDGYINRPVMFNQDDVFLEFSYYFAQPGTGNRLVLSINDTEVWSLPATLSESGYFRSSGAIDISSWAGQTVDLEIRLSTQSDSEPAEVWVDDLLTRKSDLSLRGTVWKDEDSDGIHDVSEAGVADVVVNLLDKNGDSLGVQAITDGDGNYAFSGLAPGDYRVSFVKPTGHLLTTQSTGTSPVLDSDPDQYTGVTSSVPLNTQQTTGVFDAGLIDAGSITGFVFEDLDGNGVFDPTQERGLSGVTVYLDVDEDGTFSDGDISTQTLLDDPSTLDVDESGQYYFGDLNAGTYVVRQVLQSGYKQTSSLDREFVKHEIDTTTSAIYSVSAAYLNADERVDIITTSWNSFSLAWFEQDSQGSFNEHSISTSFDGAGRVWAGYINSDNDQLDIVFASNNNKILWYEQDDIGGFIEHVISNQEDTLADFCIVDIDGDDRLDVLVASWFDNTLACYKQVETGGFERHTISTLLHDPRSVYADDVNGDGRIDVLSASYSYDTIVWFEQNTTGLFSKHVISDSVENPSWISSAFINNDGYLDVLSVDNGRGVAWYEQDALGNFIPHTIGHDGYEVSALDINSDGLVDVLATKSSSHIIWYEQDKLGNFFEHVIDDQIVAPSAYAVDVNGDDELDIVAVSQFDGIIRWYEQTATIRDSVLTLDSNTKHQDVNFGSLPMHIPPEITSLSDTSIPESTTSVLTVSAESGDMPSDNLSFNINGGSDASLFYINSSTGELSFVTSPDYENPQDADSDNIYELTVQVSDGELTDSQSIQVTVTNVDDEAPVLSLSDQTVDEHAQLMFTITASDADTPSGDLVFSLVGDSVGTITSDGVYSWTPGESDHGDHEVTIQVTVGQRTDVQTLTITVNETNESPILTVSDTQVVENTTYVLTASATDADFPSQALTYSVSGADADLFNIDPGTGALSFKVAPDYEAPQDVDTDNVYELTVQVSDGELSDSQAIEVTVTDANDTVTSSELDVVYRVVSTVSGSDVMTDSSFSSYDSLTSIQEGDSFYIEVWLRDQGDLVDGIVGGEVDIAFDQSMLQAGSISHGSIFTFDDGDDQIDNTSGLIRNFGRGTLDADVGTDSWARLGYVSMTGIEDGTASISLSAGSDPFAQSGGTGLDWETVNLSGSPAALEITAVPELNLQLRLASAAHDSDHLSDEDFDAYDSLSSVRAGQNMVAEIWLRDIGNMLNGISGGDVDITFDSLLFNATALHQGSDFTLDDGDDQIDNTSGLIDNLGWGSVSADIATTGWVRLGYVDLTALEEGTASFDVLAGLDGFSQSDGSEIAWSGVLHEGLPAQVEVLPAGGVDVHIIPRLSSSELVTLSSLPSADTNSPDGTGGSPFAQREDTDFYVEIWVRSDQTNADGISSGSVELTFDATYGQVMSVEHGELFTDSPIEVIDNTTGSVQLGGLTSQTDQGDDEYVLLGRVVFQGHVPVDEVNHVWDTQNLNLQVNESSLAFELNEMGDVTGTLQGVPTISIRPMIYDVNDDGRVNFSDLGVFASAFREGSVSDDGPPYTRWADFNNDGRVNFSDLGLFASAFRGGANDTPDVPFPDWWKQSHAVVQMQSSSAPQTSANQLSLVQEDGSNDLALALAVASSSSRVVKNLSNPLYKIQLQLVGEDDESPRNSILDLI